MWKSVLAGFEALGQQAAALIPGHPFRQTVSRIWGELHSPVETITVARETKSDKRQNPTTHICRTEMSTRQNHVAFWML